MPQTVEQLIELRRKAQAAIQGPYWVQAERESPQGRLDAEIVYGDPDDPQDQYSLIDVYDIPTYEYLAALYPQVVLELLDELEQLRKEVAAKQQNDPSCWYCGYKIDPVRHPGRHVVVADLGPGGYGVTDDYWVHIDSDCLDKEQHAETQRKRSTPIPGG